MIEDEDYLKTQLITYLGNKRVLLPLIEKILISIVKKLDHKISFLDLFSGTGIVSRMARKYSYEVICNDLELYSYITNKCYQSNVIDAELIKYHIDNINNMGLDVGFITENYSPKDEHNIQSGERVFYTPRNAMFLDTACQYIQHVDDILKPHLLGPIIAQASTNVNTSGVFKGFYKDSGIGKYGGKGRNALTRIQRDIKAIMPVQSNFYCNNYIFQKDANELVGRINVDVAYIDPPYNQHPYGSNYFMLNLLCDYKEPQQISKVAGIPKNWNRSLYNKKQKAAETLFNLIGNLKAKYAVISYNSEGFININDMIKNLSSFGKLTVMDTKYNTFRACRNLKDRNVHVTEYLFVVQLS